MRGTLVVLLLLYAAAIAMAGSRCLPRASWPLCAPRAAIAAWQAATLSVIASVVAAGLILSVPCLRISTDAGVLRACLSLMRAQYATPEGALAAAAGSVLVVVVLGRIAWCIGAAMAGAHRRRARHDDVLALIARPGPAGVRLIDDEHPAVYCLPGRRRIVMTTGALRCLDARQLAAVLAHERAHLSGRHHLVLTFANALRDAFPVAGFFTTAARQIGDLIEVAADDAAIRREHRLTLAGALLAVASAGVPAGALGAGGTAAAQRIRRLIDPQGRPSPTRRAFTSATLAAVSILALTAPALALITLTHCPPCPYVPGW